jgi:hypothetical protein
MEDFVSWRLFRLTLLLIPSDRRQAESEAHDGEGQGQAQLVR